MIFQVQGQEIWFEHFCWSPTRLSDHHHYGNYLLRHGTQFPAHLGHDCHCDWNLLRLVTPYSIHLGQVVLLEVLVSVFTRVHCERDADKKGKNLLSRSEKRSMYCLSCIRVQLKFITLWSISWAWSHCQWHRVSHRRRSTVQHYKLWACLWPMPNTIKYQM